MSGGLKLDSKADQGKAFLDVSKNFTTPLIDALEAEPSVADSFRRTYSPEYLEPIIRLEAMIDARIDKALARLVSLQEYKRMRGTFTRRLTSTPILPRPIEWPPGATLGARSMAG
jgi:hypothetical protein